jgi:hypothetical protein
MFDPIVPLDGYGREASTVADVAGFGSISCAAGTLGRDDEIGDPVDVGPGVLPEDLSGWDMSRCQTRVNEVRRTIHSRHGGAHATSSEFRSSSSSSLPITRRADSSGVRPSVRTVSSGLDGTS